MATGGSGGTPRGRTRERSRDGSPGASSTARLTEAALAAQAQATVDRVRELVAIGAIHPAPDGSFAAADVLRVRTVAAFEAGGITLEVLRVGLERRITTFDYIDRIMPSLSPISGRTYGEFAASLGSRARHLDVVYPAFGLPRPDPSRPLRVADEEVIADFLESWDVGSDEAVARAARIIGESVRRAADGWAALVVEYVTGPPTGDPAPVDELLPTVIEPSGRIARVAKPLLGWLLDRHLERAIDALNVDALEAVAAQLGLLPPRIDHPPAILFVDLEGYTRLTEATGDEVAASFAARLAQVADEVARRHGGEVVKLLGDGAMLRFPAAGPAVAAGLALLRAVPDAGLPQAHVGVSAGRVVARDGDYFGHTVNVAARVAGRAGPGEVLVTGETVTAVGDDVPARQARGVGSAGSDEGAGLTGVTFEPIGRERLRNVAEPVALFRAVAAPASSPLA